MVWSLEQELSPGVGATVSVYVRVTRTVTELLTVTVACPPQVGSVSSDEVKRPEISRVADAATSVVKVEVVVSVTTSVLMVKTVVDTAEVLWTVESHEFSSEEIEGLCAEEWMSKLRVEAPVIVAVDKVVKEMTERPVPGLIGLVQGISVTWALLETRLTYELAVTGSSELVDVVPLGLMEPG
jgi:hypothetical protein